MTTPKILHRIGIECFTDLRGNLNVAELHLGTDFKIKRMYYISGVSEDKSRGAHAHKKLKQIFFAVSGSFELTVSDGSTSETVVLKAHQDGYLLSAGYWRELKNFKENAICLVLASEHFESNDYIHSFNDFLSWKSHA